MEAKNVIGLMSGTSLDGIDAALVRVNEDTKLEVELIEFISKPYSSQLKDMILTCSAERKSRVDLICDLNVKLGNLFAEAVQELIEKADYTGKEVDLIGSHGQTIYHNVRGEQNSTLQIGSGGVIAEKTGITTVCNFRIRDIAAGGEGAPLVPYVDFLLYGKEDCSRVLQNIGGIGNYTYLPAGSNLSEVKGSDTGPGNMMIDIAINKLSDGQLEFDKDGRWAAEGEVSERLLDYMMNHPFIEKDAPKSTGREEFGQSYVNRVFNKADLLSLSPKDVIASITAFTALSIADTYQRFLPSDIDQVIIGGGGSYNPVLVDMIESYLDSKIEVLTQQDLGYNSEAKEAVAFAVLGYQTMKGQPNNVPGATGAGRRVVLGDIIPGNKFYQYLNWS